MVEVEINSYCNSYLENAFFRQSKLYVRVSIILPVRWIKANNYSCPNKIISQKHQKLSSHMKEKQFDAVASGLSNMPPEVSISKTQLLRVRIWVIDMTHIIWAIRMSRGNLFKRWPKQIWAVHVKVSSEIE